MKSFSLNLLYYTNFLLFYIYVFISFIKVLKKSSKSHPVIGDYFYLLLLFTLLILRCVKLITIWLKDLSKSIRIMLVLIFSDSNKRAFLKRLLNYYFNNNV